MPITPCDSLFGSYLDLCVEQALLDDDDRTVFAEMVPLYPPTYVSYDVESTTTIEALALSAGFVRPH